MLKSKIGVVLFSVTLASCAIRPVPEDFAMGITPEDEGEITTTTAIVQRIRCEARQAIAKVTMGFIRDDMQPLFEPGRTPEQEQVYYKVIDEQGRLSFDRIISSYYHNGKFDPELSRYLPKREDESFSLAQELGVVEKFADSGVGYLFTFKSTVDNDLTGGLLNLNWPLNNNGKTTFGIGGEYKRQRQNERKFKLVETIEAIVLDPELNVQQKHSKVMCNEHDITYKPNYHYPIYGKINLLDTFSTFAGVIVRTKTSGVPKDAIPNIDTTFKAFASQDLKDEIKFTTTVSGSAKPTLTLAPASSGLSLTSGTVGLSGQRMEVHSLFLLLKQNGVDQVLDKLELERLERNANGVIAIAIP